MSITPGTRFGPHEVLSLLGAGCVGEVYKSRDTLLTRTAAIKALPILAMAPLSTEVSARPLTVIVNWDATLGK